jgi:flagellar hook-associated protein 1 FlgK
MASALSALQTNSAALRVVSNNVANVNTPGYARRVVTEQAQSVGGELSGVGIADVQRVVDQFLNQENLSAQSGSARYTAQTSVFDQLNGLLGSPGDSTSLTSQLSSLSTALGQATLSPTASASQLGALSGFQNLASSISTLGSSISGLQTQVDQQVGTTVTSANALIKQVYDLNAQIQTVSATGDTASALLDQRDTALQNLSQLMDVRTQTLSDGRVAVSTTDGMSLVGDSYAQLSYTGGSTAGVYNPIMLQNMNGQSGQPIGPAQALDPHLAGGQIKGLLDMRDGTLADLSQELGNFARTTALAYNTQHNANTAFPPPTSLTGRDTGLLSSDALNFSGKTTVAAADSNGDLVSRIDVDFAAHTLSVDGGPAASFTNTVGGFTTALNTALGSNGTASFSNGVLSIAASGGKGIVTQDDASQPASRGGSGFSQFFGLNDLFTTSAPSILATGLSGSDASGLAAGGKIDLSVRGTDGSVLKTGSVTITAGMTIGNVVSALNTSMGSAATFTLNSDGSIGETTAASGASIQVSGDTTARGTTGMSFTELFGIGTGQAAAPALGFAVNGAIASSPQRLAFAQSQITSSTSVGDTIVGSGDSSGALALQNVAIARQSFGPAGQLGAQSASLSAYAGTFYQSVATLSQTATANQTSQSDRLTEAQSRQASTSGVSLDEELSNMMTYQQAYSAGARLLNVVDQLYNTLLQVQ